MTPTERASSPTVQDLSRCALLARLSDDARRELASRMTVEYVPPTSSAVVEREGGSRFYVVLAGALAVEQSEEGERAVLHPGDYFGEIALLGGVPRTASVRALSPATVASCDRATFDELVRLLFEQ